MEAQVISLPILDAVGLALAVVNEACRGGETRVIAAVHPGMSIGGAVAGALARSREQLQFEMIDLSAHAACRDLEVLVVMQREHGLFL